MNDVSIPDDRVKLVFIADLFADDIAGGGEVNNEELMQLLVSDYHWHILKIKSTECTETVLKQIEENGYTKFIVGNFLGLSEYAKNWLKTKDYIIYEHDHKYVRNRNPAAYKDFIAPDDELVHVDFYRNANVVICQSKFHKDILQKNLKIDHVQSVGGNLWSLIALEEMRELSQQPKKALCSIMETSTAHKNSLGSIRACELKKIKYELIPNISNELFLERIGTNETFIFLPKTPETLSRIVVEARMMNVKVITNNLVGATQEDWFSLKGPQLIDFMISKRQQIVEQEYEALQ